MIKNENVVIVYSNKKAAEILSLFVKQAEFHVTSKNTKFIIITNDREIDIDSKLNFHYSFYEETEPFYMHMVNALNDEHSDYFYYMQDDFLFYDEFNFEDNKILSDLKKYSKEGYSFIKAELGRFNKKEWKEYLHLDENETYFLSYQPTLWNRKIFLDIMKKSKVTSIRHEYESCCGVFGEIFREMKYKGLGAKEGRLIPVIEAIHMGKWRSFKSNPQDLERLHKIHEKNNINPTIRGFKK